MNQSVVKEGITMLFNHLKIIFSKLIKVQSAMLCISSFMLRGICLKWGCMLITPVNSSVFICYVFMQDESRHGTGLLWNMGS